MALTKVGKEGITGISNFSDATAITIDSSEKVGIGQSSPTSTLTVRAFEDSVNGGIRFESADGSENATIDINNSANFRIRINGSDRMRLDDGGKIYFNTITLPSTSNTGGVVINDETFDRAIIHCAHTDSGSRDLIRFFGNSSTTQAGQIKCNQTSVAYQTSSDYRLKQGVEDMTGAIDRVKALAPKRFNFIADPDTTVDGFLAHEAQTVVPEAVTGTKDEVDDDGNAVMQGIDQSKLVPLLTGALREAIAKIETLEARVKTLEDA